MTRFACCVKEFEFHHEGNNVLARRVTWSDLPYRKITLALLWGRGGELDNSWWMMVARPVAVELETKPDLKEI